MIDYLKVKVEKLLKIVKYIMEKNKKIGLIVLVIALVAGAAYGFMSARPQTPEEELMAAERKTTGADSYSVDMDMNLEVEGLEEAPEVSFSASGDYDRLERAFDGEGEFDISMEGLAANFGTRITFVDDNLYGRVTTFPYLALPLGSDQVETLTENDILLLENTSQQIDLFLEGFFMELGVEPLTFDELLQKSEEISEEMWKEGVMIVENVEEDELGGERAQKYTVKIDGEEMADFIADLIEDYEIMDLFPQFTEEQKEEMLSEIDRELRQSYQEEEIYAWVQDGYLVKMEIVSTTIVEEEDLPEVDELDEMPESITMRMVVDYSNFNEEFEIVAPEDYITMEELLEELQLFQMLQLNMEDLELEEEVEM